MTELLFTPIAAANLTLLVLHVVVLGYLLSVRGKSRATWWLVATFGGLFLLSLSGLGNALYAPAPWMRQSQGLLFVVGTGLFLWSYLHFAYRFLENPFRRAARIVLWVTSLLLAADLGYAAYEILVLTTGGPRTPAHAALGLGFLLWATVVLVRKMRRAAPQGGRPDAEPEHRNRRAYRAYALLNGFGIVFLLLVTLSIVAGTNPEEGGVLLLLLMLCSFCFFFGIVVVYLNHAPEPTSVQVKLIGLSLSLT